jgi:uncharacterized protein YndB with AHSA1/START domain
MILNRTVSLTDCSLPPVQASVDLAIGSLQVSVCIPASVEEAFAALTKRLEVMNWFGNLSADLITGENCRLDFGDGDFFDITDTALRPPYSLSYRWRFLGTGPRDTISWTIEPRGHESMVTVSDAEVGRTESGVQEMIEGWTDFLIRLQSYATTGRNHRYSWRREFNGSIELPMKRTAAFDILISEYGQQRWLPWTGPAIAENVTTHLTDGVEPEQVRISNVKNHAFGLTFQLIAAGWDGATFCSLGIEERAQGSLLVISHGGWDKIGLTESERRSQRRRISELWTKSLHRAQMVIAAAKNRD